MNAVIDRPRPGTSKQTGNRAAARVRRREPLTLAEARQLGRNNLDAPMPNAVAR